VLLPSTLPWSSRVTRRDRRRSIGNRWCPALILIGQGELPLRHIKHGFARNRVDHLCREAIAFGCALPTLVRCFRVTRQAATFLDYARRERCSVSQPLVP
jgi:hypothetical protein